MTKIGAVIRDMSWRTASEPRASRWSRLLESADAVLHASAMGCLISLLSVGMQAVVAVSDSTETLWFVIGFVVVATPIALLFAGMTWIVGIGLAVFAGRIAQRFVRSGWFWPNWIALWAFVVAGLGSVFHLSPFLSPLAVEGIMNGGPHWHVLVAAQYAAIGFVAGLVLQRHAQRGGAISL